MLLTGGTILHLSRAKIEFSSLDPWMLILLPLLWLQGRSGPSPWREALTRVTEYFADPERGNRRSLWLFLTVVLAATLAHFLKHWNLDTHAHDVVPLHQALLWAFQTPPMRCDGCPGDTFLGSHLSFPLFLLALPFQWAPFRAPLVADEWIFALHSAIAALGVIASLRALRLDRKPGLVFWAVLPIVASRAFRSGLVWDFREDVLGFAFLLGACVTLEKRRWGAYAACVALAALSKENFAFVTAMLAAPAWFVARSRRAAVLTLVGSLAYAAFEFQWLIPHFTPVVQTQSQIMVRLGDFGATPTQIVLNLLFSPKAWWQILSTRLFTPDRLRYLLFLTAPFLPFLRRKSLPWLVPLAAGVAMNLLSGSATQRSLQFHYDWITLPFLIMGAWTCLPELAPALVGRRAAWALLLTLALSGRWPGWDISRHWPTANAFGDNARERAFLRSLEFDARPDARLYANGHVLAQLTLLESRQLRIAEPLDPAALGPGDVAIVDHREVGDTQALPRLRETPFRRHATSPGGRFEVYERAP